MGQLRQELESEGLRAETGEPTRDLNPGAARGRQRLALLFPPMHWHPVVAVAGVLVFGLVTLGGVTRLFRWEDVGNWEQAAVLVLNSAFSIIIGIRGCSYFMRPTAR